MSIGKFSRRLSARGGYGVCAVCEDTPREERGTGEKRVDGLLVLDGIMLQWRVTRRHVWEDDYPMLEPRDPRVVITLVCHRHVES